MTEEAVVVAVCPESSLPVQKEMLLEPCHNTAVEHKSLCVSFPIQAVSHTRQASLNLLVDSAAYLFSIMGELCHSSLFQSLEKLQHDLITALDAFQKDARVQAYPAESILAARRALCATLDDIISHSAWASDREWDSYSLLENVLQEPLEGNPFFVTLERLMQEPDLYIDVLEFMYICLSLGFKGRYRYSEYDQGQLSQMTQGLYQLIRAKRRHVSPIVFPTPPRATLQKKTTAYYFSWTVLFASVGLTAILFLGVHYLFSVTAAPTLKTLITIGKLT